MRWHFVVPGLVLSVVLIATVPRAQTDAYDLLIRNGRIVDGTGNPWFRRATASRTGRIRAAGLERDVTFTPASELDAGTQAAVDAAYHAKYDRYGPQIVGTVTGPHAALVTLRLVPQAAA